MKSCSLAMQICFKKVIIYLFFLLIKLNSQEIPKEFFLRDIYYILLNDSTYFQEHTTLGPLRYSKLFYHNTDKFFNSNNLKLTKSDSGNFNYQIGSTMLNEDMSIYTYVHFTYKNKFFIYLYPRTVSNPESFPRYTGIPRQKKRLGFNSSEVDVSGIGYENHWINIQFGRGRQVWGAGDNLALVLNEHSPSYDHLQINTNFGKVRGKFFNGYLETVDDINRYISGRGIEITNDKNIILSLSEIAIYSGEGRPLDISYLNPITSHIELELNNRSNRLGDSGGNAIWQISLQSIVQNKILISFNLILDELTLDNKFYDDKRDRGLGFSGELSFINEVKERFKMKYNCYLKYVSPRSLKHGSGYNNFVIRNEPLGYQLGNDFIKYGIGLNYFNLRNFFLRLNINYHKVGQNSIIYSPYSPNENYYSRNFISPQNSTNTYLGLNINYLLKSNFRLSSKIILPHIDNYKNKIEFNFGLDYFYRNF